MDVGQDLLIGSQQPAGQVWAVGLVCCVRWHDLHADGGVQPEPKSWAVLEGYEGAHVCGWCAAACLQRAGRAFVWGCGGLCVDIVRRHGVWSRFGTHEHAHFCLSA